MKLSHGNIFCVPNTRDRLNWSGMSMDGDQVKSGWLVNRTSTTRFLVQDYIPSFVPDAGYTSNFGFQWQKHAKVQLDSNTGSTYSRDRLFKTTQWPEHVNLDGKLILEAGSGAGRFTEVLASLGGLVYSFDYSEAVHANYSNNGRKDNVAIFRASIYEMPFAEKTFDHVICLGVLQHTPSVKDSFLQLARMVRPGGELVVDVYPRTWRHMLHWKYLMRPLTVNMDPVRLHRFVNWYVPKLMPLSALFEKIGGAWLRRLVPVMDQSNKKVSKDIQKEWAILDTYDALSAAYDQPQSGDTIFSWFKEAGFKNVKIDKRHVAGVGTAP